MFRRRILFLLFVLALMLSPLGMHSHVVATAAAVAPTVQTPLELVVEVDPSLDLENFHPLDAFIVRFNQPMDPDSDPEPVLTHPYVEGECEWNDDRTELRFRQEGGFSPGKRYLIYLGGKYEVNYR
jgi:hypothetical protein